MKLIYNVNDKPKFGQTIVFAIQQLLAIMAATLVVPVITNQAAGLSGADAMSPAAALFGAGIGTLVYLLFTKFKSPVFLGSSFAFLGSMAAAFAGAATSAALGYLGLIIGTAFAGLVYIIIAIIVKCAGTGWINKLMPVVVIGPTVAIIGLSLAGNAIGDLQKVNYATPDDIEQYTVVSVTPTVWDAESGAYVDGDEIYQVYAKGENGEQSGEAISSITAQKNEDGSFSLSSYKGSTYVAIICGLITLAVTVACATYGKKMVRLIPFILGILAGYAAASVFYIIGIAADIPALCIIDYSALVNNFKEITLSSFVSLPSFTFIKAFGAFGELSAEYIGTIAVAYVPVAFVVFAEHIADHKNLSTIIESDLLEKPGLHRTLLGDGVGSIAGAFFGGCPNTTYGESVGCVAITGNASVVTILATSLLAIVISLISPFVAFVNTIPSCVMGGVCIALYGFIAVSGLKMVQKVDLEDNSNLFVVSVILIAGIGSLSVTFGKVVVTPIACALILGILTNILVSAKRKQSK